MDIPNISTEIIIFLKEPNSHLPFVDVYIHGLSPHLLNASFEGLVNGCIFGHLVKVSMSPDKEVERECELREGALRHALHGRLVVHLQPPVAPRPREPHHVPLVES